MDRHWTYSQREAIEAAGGDVCVSAGAGSGKTGVLVERFVRIVRESASGQLAADERARVGEILVITFTDKATREMKSRIVEGLMAAGLYEQRRELETAYISTIHGFCSRVLKENPFEAGIDPEFSVLDENEARRLLRGVFEDVLEAAFLQGDEPITELAAQAQNARLFGTDLRDPLAALASAAETALARLRGAGHRLESLQEMVAGGPDAVARASRAPALRRINEAVDLLREGLERMEALPPLGLGMLEAKRRSLRECGARLQALEAGAQWPDVETVLQAAKEIARLCAGTPRPRGTAPGVELQLLDLLGELRSRARTLEGLFSFDAAGEERAAELCYGFYSLLARLWSAYADAKRSQGVLDNDDLQAEAVHVLETSHSVLGRYRRRFRHVMVDEFQDTNRLQTRLVELLSEEGIQAFRRSGVQESGGGGPKSEVRSPHGNLSVSGHPSPVTRPPRLFIVGDVQQSIYAFRNAEPAIFQEMERRFRTDRAGRHITLAENFRSRPELLRFVNRLFGQAWGQSSVPGGQHAEFTPLVAAAQHEPKDAPSIELMLARDPGRDAYVEMEAAALASRIQRIVSRQQVRITDRSHPRCGEPVGYADIAVMLRTLTQIEQYERAFGEAGIPFFVVGGGRGYYARREIRDVMNVLTVLDSPLDDVALVATLRSPMVGLDVDTLFALGLFSRERAGARRAPLYPHIATFLEEGAADADEKERLRRFYLMAENLRLEESRLDVARILEQILEATQYDARLLVRPNGRRRLANVRKLLQMANASSVHGVGDFIRRLRDLEKVSEREGDAPTEEEGADVVRLITIHKAKGLEFPVVFLADMGRSLFRAESSVFLCDGPSMALGCRLDGYKTAAYTAIEAERRRIEEAEAMRLLYVALTRAREHLLLCGSTAAKQRRPNWADMVFQQLGILAPPDRVEIRSLGDGDKLRIVPIGSPG